MSFPSVTEDVKWETNLCFCVGGKIFCVASLNPSHHFSFKVSDEEFEELTQREGIIPTPYLARARWVMVQDVIQISKKEVNDYIRASYDLIKAKLPAKLKAELGLD